MHYLKTWIVQAAVAASPQETSTKIVVCCLETSLVTPAKVINYLEGRFTWLVSAFGDSVTPQSPHLLAGTPLILESAYKITQLVSLIAEFVKAILTASCWRLRNDVMALSRIIVVKLMLHLWLILLL